jgi:hypothetical protein
LTVRYVTTNEIERRIFGSTHYADLVFTTCSKLLSNILDEILNYCATEDYKFMRMGFYADGSTNKMIVFAELFYDIDEWNPVIIYVLTPRVLWLN